MKNILLLLLCGLLFTSCKLHAIKMGTKPTPSTSLSLKTKGGKSIEVKEMKEKSRKIIADGKEYKKNDIQEYSDGKGYYIRVDKSNFAVKKQEGDISVYTTTGEHSSTTYTGVTPSSPSGWSSSSHSHTTYYLQKATSPALLLMNYKNVKSLIATNEPAYKYILSYEHARHRGKTVKYIGLGVIASSIALLAFDLGDGADAIGGMGIAGGTIVTFTGFFKQAAAGINLKKAIGKHNGVYDDK